MGMILMSLGAVVLAVLVYGELYAVWASNKYPPTGQLVSHQGGRLHVRLLGEGTEHQPVLMIHGASANGRAFLDTIVPELVDEFELIIPDRPGHGHSTRPRNAWRLDVQAEAMVRALDHAGTEKAMIVAHSFGSAVAMRVALDYPDRVAGIVLLAPATHPWPGKTNIHNRLVANPVYGPLYARIAPLAGPLLAPAGIENVFSPQAPPANYADELGLALLFRPRNFRANGRDVAAANGEFAAQAEQYHRVTAPVVIFSGSRDSVVAPSLHAEALKTILQRNEIVRLEETGHMPHHFHADMIARSVRDMSDQIDENRGLEVEP